MRLPAAALIGVLFAGACTADSIESAIDVPLPDYLPECADQYEDGKLIEYSVDGDFARACVDRGELMAPVPVDLRCSDNRQLLFNDYAWGFQGEEMTLFDPPGNQRLEENDDLRELVLDCLRSDVDPDVDEDDDDGS